MITPDLNPDTCTDDELIAAYLAMGFDAAEAQIFVAQIRIASETFPS